MKVLYCSAEVFESEAAKQRREKKAPIVCDGRRAEILYGGKVLTLSKKWQNVLEFDKQK